MIRKAYLAVISIVYLYATPSNIAYDAMMKGEPSISTNIIYIVGLIALVWFSYTLGRDSKGERH